MKVLRRKLKELGVHYDNARKNGKSGIIVRTSQVILHIPNKYLNNYFQINHSYLISINHYLITHEKFKEKLQDFNVKVNEETKGGLFVITSKEIHKDVKIFNFLKEYAYISSYEKFIFN